MLPPVLMPPRALAKRPILTRQRWDAFLPPPLRPLVRAYLFGYVFSVGPSILTLVLRHLLSHLRRRPRPANDDRSQRPEPEPEPEPELELELDRDRDRDRELGPEPAFVDVLSKTLRAATHWQRFPAFCATLAGGSTLFQPVLGRLIARLLWDSSETRRSRLSSCLSSFIAAWLGLQLLQSQSRIPSTSALATTATPHASPRQDPRPRTQAGRTLDITLFAATRALDVIIGQVWSQRRNRRSPPSASAISQTIDQLASKLVDPLVFAVSCALIMWNWFYKPSALPRTYNKWIASAAAVDQRLIIALQRCRDRTIQYGEDTGQASLLQAMCKDYRWPEEWGNPAVSIPFPCEMVHMGVGPSCELHALSRFRRAWLWSLRTYLPLQLAVLLVRLRASKNPRIDFVRTLVSASRSSAFLGLFITLFYYGVCLTRTRLGPRLLGTHVEARQRIDSGLCIGAGCLICGWSVLLEPSDRRKELALFVTPRALATLLPRRYSAEKQWMERLVFATSSAVLFTCVLENKRQVRGVLGEVLKTVFAA